MFQSILMRYKRLSKYITQRRHTRKNYSTGIAYSIAGIMDNFAIRENFQHIFDTWIKARNFQNFHILRNIY